MGYTAGIQPAGEWRFFSWHPLLMTVGMVGCTGVGAVTKKLGGYENTKVSSKTTTTKSIVLAVLVCSLAVWLAGERIRGGVVGAHPGPKCNHAHAKLLLSLCAI